jgi:hypothetical protein
VKCLAHEEATKTAATHVTSLVDVLGSGNKENAYNNEREDQIEQNRIIWPVRKIL